MSQKAISMIGVVSISNESGKAYENDLLSIR